MATARDTIAPAAAETLRELVRLNEEEKLVAYFKDLTEAERRAHWPVVEETYKTLDKELKGEQTNQAFHNAYSVYRLAVTLVLATGTLSQAKRHWGTIFFNGTAQSLLRDREPEWLADICEHALDEDKSRWTSGSTWHFVHQLVREGKIGQPQSDGYVLGLINAFHTHGEKRLISEQLQQFPEIIDSLIWRLFEIEGGGEVSLANFDKYTGHWGGTWNDTFLALARDGMLDRRRLLECSLDALNRGFSQYRAGWFSRFHEALKPTLDERERLAPRYIDLLASPIPPTLSMSLKALQKLQKANRLGDVDLIGRLEPALYAKAAGTVKLAIKMLSEEIKHQPAQTEPALRTMAAALEHPKADVQALALEIIRRDGDPNGQDLMSAVEERLSVMTAPIRREAEAWLGTLESGLSPSEDVSGDLANLKKRAAALPESLSKCAGVDAALAACEDGSRTIPAVSFTGMDIPRLDPDTAITPIATLAELVEEATIALERPDDFVRAEQVVEASVRLSGSISDNERDVLNPLVSMFRKLLKTAEKQPHRLYGKGPMSGSLWMVLSALSQCEFVSLSAAPDDPQSIFLFRAHEIAQAIQHGQAVQLLSAPTHRDVWIDPVVLAERTLLMDSADSEIGLADQVLALLRLAPDRRHEALAQVVALDSEWGKALRYALGEDVEVGKTMPLWVAASRARAPFEDDLKLLKKFKLDKAGADRSASASVRYQRRSAGPRSEYSYTITSLQWQTASTIETTKERHWLDPSSMLQNIELVGKKDQKKRTTAYCPSILLHNPALPRKVMHREYGIPASAWLPAIWPGNPEPLFAVAALLDPDGIDDETPRPAYKPRPEGFEIMLDPDIPPSPIMAVAVAHALAAFDKGDGQAGVDALITLIDDGRIDADGLAAALVPMLTTGYIVPQRVTPRLREVAAVGPVHAATLLEALVQTIGEAGDEIDAKTQRSLHHILAFLHELCVETGEAIDSEPCLAFLASIKGTGKSAKLAKTLRTLKQDTAQSAQTRRTVAVQALTARVDRAERWLRYQA